MMTNLSGASDFDSRAFRQALGSFATGVTVITAEGADGTKVGTTANSFSSLSLDPPLVLWSCIKASNSCPVFESASHFNVNVLAFDQLDISNHFARSQDDKFADVEWSEGVGGAPILPNCAARFQCETYNQLEGGDHRIFIGKVVAFDDLGRSPLCFHQGSYSMVVNHPGGRPDAHDSSVGKALGGRVGDHTFFQILMALRSYQAKYQPKLEVLGVSLIESRALLMLNEQAGLDAEELVAHVNAPITEVEVALVNLANLGLVTARDAGYEITSDGRAKADQCWSIAEAHALEAFEGVSQERIDTFRSVLRHLINQ